MSFGFLFCPNCGYKSGPLESNEWDYYCPDCGENLDHKIDAVSTTQAI